MKIYICGDSTAAIYGPELAPLTGWGQLLPELMPESDIDNRAFAGRSTKTFISEGRLKAIEPLLSPGDLMLIQFGHNDEGDKPERHTEPWADFTDNLNTFIDTALDRGAQPVLMTPICIRRWEGGILMPSHGEYLEAIVARARQRGVPLVDMYAASRAIVIGLGDEGSKALFMHLSPGEYPHWPDGSKDDTHTRKQGAMAFARAAVEGLTRQKLIDREVSRS